MIMDDIVFYLGISLDNIQYEIRITYNKDKEVYKLLNKSEGLIHINVNYEYFSDSETALKRALQIIGSLIRAYEVKTPITSINDLRQEYAMLEEVSRIRKDIFESYEKTYLKPLNRTTWSNWMNGQDPDAVKKNIIENAIAKYNGRIKIQDITSNE